MLGCGVWGVGVLGVGCGLSGKLDRKKLRKNFQKAGLPGALEKDIAAYFAESPFNLPGQAPFL